MKKMELLTEYINAEENTVKLYYDIDNEKVLELNYTTQETAFYIDTDFNIECLDSVVEVKYLSDTFIRYLLSEYIEMDKNINNYDYNMERLFRNVFGYLADKR